MNSLKFHFRTALSNIFRNIGINLLTVFSIGVGLFLIVITAITVASLQRAVEEWTRGFGVVVYLEDGLSAVSARSLKARIERDPEVLSARYVPREAALETLRKAVGEALLDGLGEKNPLPDSLELKPAADALEPSRVEALAERLAALPGVADVQFGRKWVESISRTARQAMLLGSALGVALSIGILFILSNTIKIDFYRRSTEVEILKLLGATRGFIRMPFLIEGGLVGLTAGLLAAAASVGAIQWLTAGQGLPVALPWSPGAGVAAVVGFGALLGLAGSFVSLGRIRL